MSIAPKLQQFLDEASGRATGRFLGPSARVVAFSGAPLPVERHDKTAATAPAWLTRVLGKNA